MNPSNLCQPEAAYTCRLHWNCYTGILKMRLLFSVPVLFCSLRCRTQRHDTMRIYAAGGVLLEVKDLEAKVAETGQTILRGVNLTIREGEVSENFHIVPLILRCCKWPPSDVRKPMQQSDCGLQSVSRKDIP